MVPDVGVVIPHLAEAIHTVITIDSSDMFEGILLDAVFGGEWRCWKLGVGCGVEDDCVIECSRRAFRFSIEAKGFQCSGVELAGEGVKLHDVSAALFGFSLEELVGRGLLGVSSSQRNEESGER